MSWTAAADESTEGRYLPAVTFVRNADVAAVRKTVTELRATIPSWRHLSKISDPLKVKVLSVLAGLPQHTITYDAGPGRTVPAPGRKASRITQRRRRDACLRRLIADIGDGYHGHVRLVLDSFGAGERDDRHLLHEAARSNKVHERLDYCHLREQDEPLVLIPDAVAWAFGKGGTWPGVLGTSAERKDVEPW